MGGAIGKLVLVAGRAAAPVAKAVVEAAVLKGAELLIEAMQAGIEKRRDKGGATPA